MSRKEVTLGEGGGITYYLYGTPKSGKVKDNQKVLEPGDIVAGKYMGLTDPATDTYEKSHIRLEKADGSTVQLNYAGQLNKLIEKVAIGTEIEIVFKGKTEIKSGKWAGQPANQFQLFETGPAPAATGSDDNVPF